MMKTPKGSTSIKITPKNEVGQHLLSRVSYSTLPIKQTSGTILVLPKTDSNKYQKNCYFTAIDQKLINIYLDSSRSFHFTQFMTYGRLKKHSYKHSIEEYISYLKLRNTRTLFNKLYKIDYRNRKKMDKLVESVIQSLDI